jgi:2',3'-cyclic-nucleotide 2'-phosphodiesterase (5'-nucleotidase family)
MTLQILHYADLEDAYDDPALLGQFAGLISSLRDETTVLIGAGDNIAPGSLSLVTEGRQALDFFTEIEPDIDTLGNHDFTCGLEALLSIVCESPQCWVCANVYDNGDRFGQEAGIVPWTIIEREEHRLGVFGLAHPLTDEKSVNAEALSFTDPVAAARDTVDTIQNRAVDHVVCIAHLGEKNSHDHVDLDDLAQAADIDVILGGHIHDHPQINRVAETLLVRTAGEGEDLAELRFDGEWTASHHTTTDAMSDRTVEQQFEMLHERSGLHEVVATVEKPIVRSDETLNRGESRLGNFITDAYRWATDADIGLQHSPGIRGSTLQDDVTIADLVRLVPFNTPVMRTPVSGATLQTILAAGDELSARAKPNDWQLHLSGGTVIFDHAERQLVDATVDGEPISSSTIYSVAASEYLFRSFDVCPSDEAVEFGRQFEVLADYARTNGITPTLDGRITRLGVE